MNLKQCFLILLLFIYSDKTRSQALYDEEWYENPLGFEPVKMHTSMGFIIPAVVVGVGLLLTKRDSLNNGSNSIYSNTDYAFGYKYPYTFMTVSNTGINFSVRNWLGLGFELSTCFARNSLYKNFGVAIRPFARFYFINRKNWTCYFESGGGIAGFIKEFPESNSYDTREGTFINGITKYGIGSTIKIKNTVSASFGARHLHISNGNSKGVNRNPSWDGNGFFAGVSVGF